jgi:hypothetical protein
MSLDDGATNVAISSSGSPARRFTRRRKIVGALTVVATVAATPLLLASGTSSASSHREAPLIAGLPKYDNTDVYAFRSPSNDGSVTLISDWIPFEEPSGGPNFYPFGAVPAGSRAAAPSYNINIDNNGDGKPDITFAWTFASSYRNPNTFLYNTGVVNHLTDTTLNFRQTYNLNEYTYDSAGRATKHTLATGVPVAPSDTGLASMPNYGTLRAESIKTMGHVKTFAGQADDPFFLDLRVFDLLYGASTNNGHPTFSESGTDSLAHYNVNQVALQVPARYLALKGNTTRNPVIGIWSTTVARDANGSGAQVSRLGNPLVNEVVVPVALKDAFNSLTPDKDHTIPAVVAKVLDPEVPHLVQSIYGIPAPATPRKDLAEVFLTGISKNSGGPIQVDLNSQLLNKDVSASKFIPAEELRLNMTVPLATSGNASTLGVLGGDVQGYPNGRRLTDDVVDIELKVLEGALPPYAANTSIVTDGVNANDVPFTNTFPYSALPHHG